MEPISTPLVEVLPTVDAKEQIADTSLLKERPDIISGWRKTWVHMGIRWTILKVLLRCYNNPMDWFRGLRYFIRLRRSILGNYRVRKMVRVGDQFYMGLHIPGWDDATYRRYIAKALLDFKPHSQPAARIELAFLAMTKKCPLQCEHCSAGDTLNMKDEVGAAQYEYILDQLVSQGVFQVNFTGGEPLLKFDLLERLISHVPSGIKTWVNTSGYRLTPEKATRLKSAGLTGVAISLDHYLEEDHNRFRRHEEAYTWALNAVRNARKAGLVVAVSICLSESISNDTDLLAYMDLARGLGAHFVQFLEPKSVGHYKHREVGLSSEAKKRLEAFFLQMNFTKAYRDYPLISYHGFYERRVGCFGAGKKGIYIDADGQLNACPFCHTGYGNLLEGNWDEKLDLMARAGCSAAFY